MASRCKAPNSNQTLCIRRRRAVWDECIQANVGHHVCYIYLTQWVIKILLGCLHFSCWNEENETKATFIWAQTKSGECFIRVQEQVSISWWGFEHLRAATTCKIPPNAMVFYVCLTHLLHQDTCSLTLGLETMHFWHLKIAFIFLVLTKVFMCKELTQLQIQSLLVKDTSIIHPTYSHGTARRKIPICIPVSVDMSSLKRT